MARLPTCTWQCFVSRLTSRSPPCQMRRCAILPPSALVKGLPQDDQEISGFANVASQLPSLELAHALRLIMVSASGDQECLGAVSFSPETVTCKTFDCLVRSCRR